MQGCAPPARKFGVMHPQLRLILHPFLLIPGLFVQAVVQLLPPWVSAPIVKRMQTANEPWRR